MVSRLLNLLVILTLLLPIHALLTDQVLDVKAVPQNIDFYLFKDIPYQYKIKTYY